MSESTPVTYDVIGVVRSPFENIEDAPFQSVAQQSARGSIELDERHLEGLAGLHGFSHIWVVSHLHQRVPTGAGESPAPHADLATRSPHHPNPIGISVLELLAIEGTTLWVAGLDLLDGTPVLDVKPYVPLFDCIRAQPPARPARIESEPRLEPPSPTPTTEAELLYFLNDPRAQRHWEARGSSRRRRQPRVRDVMFVSPKVLPYTATIGEVRAQFESTRIKVVLLVHHGACSGLLRRSDVPADALEEDAAGWFVREPATILAGASLTEGHDRLRSAPDGRLVVVDRRGQLLGLLCHNRGGTGFCNETVRCGQSSSHRTKTHWTIVRRTGRKLSQSDLLVAARGKSIELGDVLALPPDTRSRWLVVDTLAGPTGSEDDGIAVVEQLGQPANGASATSTA